jgi:hypothetical protein
MLNNGVPSLIPLSDSTPPSLIALLINEKRGRSMPSVCAQFAFFFMFGNLVQFKSLPANNKPVFPLFAEKLGSTFHDQ